MSDLPTGVREQTAHAVETEMFVCGEHGVQWLMAVEGIYQDETVHIVSRLKEPSALGNQRFRVAAFRPNEPGSGSDSSSSEDAPAPASDETAHVMTICPVDDECELAVHKPIQVSFNLKDQMQIRMHTFQLNTYELEYADFDPSGGPMPLMCAEFALKAPSAASLFDDTDVEWERKLQVHSASTRDLQHLIDKLRGYLQQNVECKTQKKNLIGQLSRFTNKIVAAKYDKWLAASGRTLREDFLSSAGNTDANIGTDAEAKYVWDMWINTLYAFRMTGAAFQELKKIGESCIVLSCIVTSLFALKFYGCVPGAVHTGRKWRTKFPSLSKMEDNFPSKSSPMKKRTLVNSTIEAGLKRSKTPQEAARAQRAEKIPRTSDRRRFAPKLSVVAAAASAAAARTRSSTRTTRTT